MDYEDQQDKLSGKKRHYSSIEDLEDISYDLENATPSKKQRCSILKQILLLGKSTKPIDNTINNASFKINVPEICYMNRLNYQIDWDDWNSRNKIDWYDY